MSSNYNPEIVVVTKVPETPEDIAGNLALAFDLYWETNERDPKTYLSKAVPLVDGLERIFAEREVIAGLVLNMRAPVFKLGEILFLDGNGREITPALGGRKPDKWLIETTTVDTLDEAIALSRQVCDDEEAAMASVRDAFKEEA